MNHLCVFSMFLVSFREFEAQYVNMSSLTPNYHAIIWNYDLHGSRCLLNLPDIRGISFQHRSRGFFFISEAVMLSNDHPDWSTVHGQQTVCFLLLILLYIIAARSTASSSRRRVLPLHSHFLNKWMRTLNFEQNQWPVGLHWCLYFLCYCFDWMFSGSSGFGGCSLCRGGSGVLLWW